MKKNEFNRLVLIGNGFDLAHGLKTSYRDFLDWYMCDAFKQFCSTTVRNYTDPLIEIKSKYYGRSSIYANTPVNFQQVLEFIQKNYFQSNNYKSDFFKRIIKLHGESKWVDIEVFYFRLLKSFFLNSNFPEKHKVIKKLNEDFSFLVKKLIEYIKTINEDILNLNKLPLETSQSILKEVISFDNESSIVKFLNFNYTETLSVIYSIAQDEIIHIHGKASQIDENPIIFGYGDESDPEYQKIEDSGENIYLDHIKSFGYFKANNYNKLLSFIDSKSFNVYIVGHSCGLSDRVLLNQIFEHPNCNGIEIFYHELKDGSDNFKEITQEISRHFKPQNKSIMRRRVMNKNSKNFIPQI